MQIQPITHKGYELLHNALPVFADIEQAGFRIDTEKLNTSVAEIRQIKVEAEEYLKSFPEYKTWKDMVGEEELKLTSTTQLRKLLYDILDYPILVETAEGQPSTDVAALEKIGTDFTNAYLKYRQAQKLSDTYLKGLSGECVDGHVHTFLNLHTVSTYRSSSDSPNFQNFPKRDDYMKRIIRSCIIPRQDHMLVEFDFKGAEVTVGAAYHNDKNMIRYLTQPGTDMHRDVIKDAYMLSDEDVTKDIRSTAKGNFTFPEFYGSYWKAIAPSLWEDSFTLTLKNGKKVIDHLVDKGVNCLGLPKGKERYPKANTFCKHIQDTENIFWDKRFAGYKKWKEEFYWRYCQRGWFDTKTGFRVHGNFKRNFVVNCPIQGSSFHVLLWAVTQVGNEIKKRNMKSKIIGQIHDSLVADVHKDEYDDFMSITLKYMTEGTQREFDWLTVPIEVEAEASPVNGTWYEMEEIKL